GAMSGGLLSAACAQIYPTYYCRLRHSWVYTATYTLGYPPNQGRGPQTSGRPHFRRRRTKTSTEHSVKVGEITESGCGCNSHTGHSRATIWCTSAVCKTRGQYAPAVRPYAGHLRDATSSSRR